MPPGPSRTDGRPELPKTYAIPRNLRPGVYVVTVQLCIHVEYVKLLVS